MLDRNARGKLVSRPDEPYSKTELTSDNFSRHGFDRYRWSEYRWTDPACVVSTPKRRPSAKASLTSVTRRAGLGLATEDVKTLANRVIRKHEEKKIGRVDPSTETALERWVQTEVLIVDESKPSL